MDLVFTLIFQVAFLPAIWTFTSILEYVIDLMVRYIYGKPGRWEWLFPKMDKNQSRDKHKIAQECM